jgi:hypothetical protein
VPGSESERPRHRLLLVIQARACQIEVHLVWAGLLLLGRKKSDSETGVVALQEHDAVERAVGHLPAQNVGPEARQTERIVRSPHRSAGDRADMVGEVALATR